MLTLKRSNAREMAEQMARDPELRRLMPARPFLPREFAFLPFGSNRFAVLCGSRREVIHSTMQLELIKRVAAQFDGTRGFDQIAEALAPIFQSAEEAARNSYELATLLYRRGLLQDGTFGVVSADDESVRFWDQYCGVEGVHHNRQDIDGARQVFTVRLSGAQNLTAPLKTTLATAGVRILSDSAETSPALELVLYDDPAGLAVMAHEGLTLFAGLVGDRFMLGPLMPGAMAPEMKSWLQSSAFRPSVYAQGSGLLSQIWPSLCAAQVYKLACGLGGAKMYSKVNVITDGPLPEGVTQRSYSVSHYIPAVAPDQSLSESALVAASQSGIEQPFSDRFNQRVYLSHYNNKNITLTQEGASVFHGVPLVRFADVSTGQPGCLVAQTATLCKWAFGIENGRRITPSGGDLRSAELLVNWPQRNIDRIPCGLYRYRGAEHALERISDAVPIKELGQAEPSPAYLIVSSHGKVARKYYDWGFRVCALDAGVSGTVLMQGAQHLSQPLALRADVDLRRLEGFIPLPFVDQRHMLSACLTQLPACDPPPALPRVKPGDLALTDEQLPIWTVELARQPLDLPAQRPQAAVLDKPLKGAPDEVQFAALLRKRRAVREVSPEPIDPELILALRAEAEAGARLYDSQLFHFLRVVATDRARGLSWDPESAEQGWQPFDTSLRLFVQSVPEQAPAALLCALDMSVLVQQQGFAGYKYALQAAGAALHTGWLGAWANGLQGSIIGSVMNDGFRSCCHTPGWHLAPVAGLIFGYETQT